MENQKVTIETVLKEHSKLSLKRVCDEAGLCYQYVFKASKTPIEGVPYDASATNFEAVQRIVDKKEIDLSKFDWEAIEASVKTFEPVNKSEDFQTETNFRLRADEKIYTVLYRNENYVCFINSEETTIAQPRVMNWDTFLHQSPRIIVTD